MLHWLPHLVLKRGGTDPQKAASSVSLHDALVMFAMVSAHYFAHSDVSKTWRFCNVFQSPRIVNLVIGMSMSDVLIGDHQHPLFFSLQMQNRGTCLNFKVYFSAAALSICNPFLTGKLVYAFSFKLFFWSLLHNQIWLTVETKIVVFVKQSFRRTEGPCQQIS